MRRVLAGVGAGLAAVLLWLITSPAPIDPAPWTPPPPTPLEGVFAINDRLAGVEWWARQLVGPESMFFEQDGALVTGLKDGRIVRVMPGRDEATLLADTHGRPLAIARHPDGRVIICDAYRGLLAMDSQGVLEVLASEHGGVPLRLVDGLAIASTGVVYFTDASARHGLDRYTDDLLEHQPTGRVLAWEPATKRTTELARGLSFANGLALAPDESYLVVAETGAYRLWRLWLTGPSAAQKELFTDALPGFPDNVRFSAARQIFWVAIGSPRESIVDLLAGWPSLRRLIAKLPKAVQPAPRRHAFVVAVDLRGRVVDVLQHRAPESYSPVTTALEHEGFLYLGSFEREGLARLRLDPPGARP